MSVASAGRLGWGGPGKTRGMRRCFRWASVILVSFGGLAACGEDDRAAVGRDVEQLAEDARREAQEAAGAAGEAGSRAGARAVAEAVRAALVAEDLQGGKNLRDVAVLREAVGKVPGEPEVTGIDDADGDGRDDDGRVEIVASEERACLTLPEEGGNVDVRSGPC